MGTEFEKDYDDEVYEDEFYDENYNEEELVDEDDEDEEEEEEKAKETEDDADWDEEKRIDFSFACEECDYRWDDYIVKRKGNLEDEEEEEFDVVCPMCGTTNVTQI